MFWSKWFWVERKFNTECYFFDPGPKSFDPRWNILDPAKTVLNYWMYYLGISIFSGVMPSFRCPKCSSSFHSTSELIVHHKSKHSKKMWQIPVIFFKCHQLPMLSMFLIANGMKSQDYSGNSRSTNNPRGLFLIFYYQFNQVVVTCQNISKLVPIVIQ